MEFAYHAAVTDQQNLVTVLDVVHEMIFEEILHSLVDRLLSFGTLRCVLAQVVGESGLSSLFVELFEWTTFVFAWMMGKDGGKLVFRFDN